MRVRTWFDGDYPITQAWANGGQRYAWNNAIGGHPGTDYGVPSGTRCYAITDNGQVIWAGPAQGFGDHCVAVWYESLGATVLYGHGQAHYVNVGDHVSYGQLLVLSDNEGWSTGPHLHVEVRLVDTPFGGNPPNVDPVTWLYMAITAHSEDNMQFAIVPITDTTHPGTVFMFKQAVKQLNPKVDWSNPVETVEQVRSFMAANGHPEVNSTPHTSGLLTAELQRVVYQLALESKNHVSY